MNPFDQSRLIEAVQAAPSILNTQPWSLRFISNDFIELRANPGKDPEGRERYLEVSDRRKREMIISCGAALYNLRLAIRVTGHVFAVWLFPNTADPDLLATVEIDSDSIRQATYREQRLFESIPLRHTTREPFRKPELEMNLVTELEEAGRMGTVNARLLHPRQLRQLLRDTAKVNKTLKANTSYLNELKRWTGPNSTGGRGVPTDAFGPLPVDEEHTPIRDLGISWPERRRERFEKKVRLVLLSTEKDTPLDWMYAGQALQKLLLTATQYHVVASFLTQLFEYHDREQDVTYSMYPWPGYCHIAIRLGNPSKVPYATPHESKL